MGISPYEIRQQPLDESLALKTILNFSENINITNRVTRKSATARNNSITALQSTHEPQIYFTLEISYKSGNSVSTYFSI